ncbi:MAG: hypothetical protein HC857_14350 [Synechococcales cyanobacterium RU_4_20]|nr:hypothetical protein [Synechococcales cyanobacterium RU_4_20]
MLSASNLTDIEQEVRHCFIQEDAPEYVEALEAGILQVCQSRLLPDETSLDWKALLRAAHTLKGGAGLARLQGLARLSHRLEDVLLAVREQRVPDLAQAQELLLRGIDDVRQLLAAAATQPDPTSDLVASLEALLEGTQVLEQDGVGAEAIAMAGGIDPVKLVLDSDFRQLLAAAQADLTHQPVAAVLANLTDSAQMLAEVLNLSWLKQCVSLVRAGLATVVTEKQAQTVLDYLNDACDRVLQDTAPLPFSWAWGQLTESVALENPATLNPVAATTEPTLRVPLSRLNQLNDRLGEMLISYETLKLEHRRVNQSNQDVRRRSRQFYQVREQLQTLYDQLLLPLSTPGRLKSGKLAAARSRASVATATSLDSEFDALELDQFTDVHSLLQDFQELLTRLEESSDDITLFSKGAEEAMLQLQEQMTGLRLDLHATRMRPFSLLAERFRRPLWDLSQRFDKPVELVVVGGETLVDRAMLDQLYDPLMHLLRNAFDHGIESRQERRQRDKPEVATLRLSARQTGTQVAIALQDDGQGINLERVYAKAMQAGLAPAERPGDATLLNYLFDSGFSTATQVGELSGRGVGLDVVKAQVEACGALSRSPPSPTRAASSRWCCRCRSIFCRYWCAKAVAIVGCPPWLRFRRCRSSIFCPYCFRLTRKASRQNWIGAARRSH